MAVLDGWVPADITIPAADATVREYKGLLKQGEKKDYLNRRLNVD